MNRARSNKSYKTNRRWQCSPNAAITNFGLGRGRDFFDDREAGPSFGYGSIPNIRLAADMLGSCSSGWIAEYFRRVATGDIVIDAKTVGNAGKRKKPKPSININFYAVVWDFKLKTMVIIYAAT